MKKEEIIELLKNGEKLYRFENQDFGTKSLFKPIKRGGKNVVSFKIGTKSIHWKTGENILSNSIISLENTEKTFGGSKKTYGIKSHLTTDAQILLNVISDNVKKDLFAYHALLKTLSNEASKNTHYDNLDAWSNKAYAYIHDMLKKYGFKNGDVEANNKNTDARFWWTIYGVLSSITYSPFLKTDVSLHHSSAYERNEAMVQEIKSLIK